MKKKAFGIVLLVLQPGSCCKGIMEFPFFGWQDMAFDWYRLFCL